MDIKLTITFLDDTTDEQILAIYNRNYYQKGRELGEIEITSENKVKTIIISPYQSEEQEEGKLNINDFTTYLVLKYKIAEIKTEGIYNNTITTEVIETDETKAEEKKTET